MNAVETDVDEEWQCENCTVVNPGRVNICDVCARTRGNAPEIFGSPAMPDLPPLASGGVGSGDDLDEGAVPKQEFGEPEHPKPNELLDIVKKLQKLFDVLSARGGLAAMAGFKPSGSAAPDPPLVEMHEDEQPIQPEHIDELEVDDPSPIVPAALGSIEEIRGLGNEREEVCDAEDDDEDVWQCRYCTYINESHLNVCDMCAKTNDTVLRKQVGLAAVARPVQPPVDDQWQCDKCTFINTTVLPRCEACNEPMAADAVRFPGHMLDDPELLAFPGRYDDFVLDEELTAAGRLDAEPLTESGDESGNEDNDNGAGGDDNFNNQSEEDKIFINRLMALGRVPTKEKALIALTLVRLEHDENIAIEVANVCSSPGEAIDYFRDCPVCFGRHPNSKIFFMLHCNHFMCNECAEAQFTTKIMEGSIMEMNCVDTECGLPDLKNKQTFEDYFTNFTVQVRNIVREEVYNIFENKLRDFALNRDPTFCWCGKCQSGVFINPNVRKVVCPVCLYAICGECKNPWMDQHDGIDCQKFADWKVANSKDVQEEGLNNFLKDKGITCPSCRLKFELTKGGCMHMICTACKFQFCEDCDSEFVAAGKCKQANCLQGAGLHAHHPRTCFFYMRDYMKEKDPVQLRKLLANNDVAAGNDPVAAGGVAGNQCPIQEQKDMPDGTKADAMCGKIVDPKCDGLCKDHFIERMATLYNKHKVDPVSLMDCTELEMELRRNGRNVPPKTLNMTEDAYKVLLEQAVRRDVPLGQNK